jgi:UDP-N-acetylglucosamine 2-epimerase
VEAGLRTGNLSHPFPEELNRVVTARIASLHFPPTEQAQRNLHTEGVPAGRIHVTGNPGIDAVLHVAGQLEQGRLPAGNWPWLDPTKHLIVVTAHRRESFGAGIQNICSALAQIAERGDTQIVYPVHRNPNILEPVMQRLAGKDRIHLLEPLDYRLMVDLIRKARLLLTDSGGLQEEAPSLGKPVLVLRETTERPEAVEAGTVKLVGTDPVRIVTETERLLTDDQECGRMSRIHNPYGDGRAAERIARISAEFVTAGY